MLPVQALNPKATPAALQDALAHLARPAVAGPIALTTGSVTENLTADQIGDAVVIAPDDSGRMVARVDGTKVRGDLNAAALAQETPAINASFIVGDGGTPTLVPGRDGRGFPPAALAGAVQAVLTQPVPRTATVPLGDLPPAFTTGDAQALGVTDVLGTTTVPVPSAPNRFANVQRATTLVAGSIIGPGETWSFLKTIGALDGANGFAIPAAAQKAGEDPSGGVDTVATAVFGAAFASGMGDTVHHPHASFVDRYPVGLDAAVVAPGTDMQWTNTGNHPVYLYASYANDAVTVALLGEKTYDQVTVQVSQRYAVVPAARAPAPSPASRWT
jgi:vancomycin resistance protein YoaR